jgi:hypothetical protein
MSRNSDPDTVWGAFKLVAAAITSVAVVFGPQVFLTESLHLPVLAGLIIVPSLLTVTPIFQAFGYFRDEPKP